MPAVFGRSAQMIAGNREVGNRFSRFVSSAWAGIDRLSGGCRRRQANSGPAGQKPHKRPLAKTRPVRCGRRRVRDRPAAPEDGHRGPVSAGTWVGPRTNRVSPKRLNTVGNPHAAGFRSPSFRRTSVWALSDAVEIVAGQIERHGARLSPKDNQTSHRTPLLLRLAIHNDIGFDPLRPQLIHRFVIFCVNILQPNFCRSGRQHSEGIQKSRGRFGEAACILKAVKFPNIDE